MNTMKILLVDTSHLYQGILQTALASDGAEIVFCKTTQEAVSLAKEHAFQFYIIAGQLADGDGLSLTATLRKSGIAEYEPIVLLTGSPTQALAEQAYSRGVNELFRKQDVEELVTFMRRFLRVYRETNCRVLYIEDAKDQQNLLKAHMLDWGMEVDAYEGADEAWDALQIKRYDIIVCDIVLGGRVSGSRLINRVRRQPAPLGNVLILATTAFDNPSRRIELYHIGIDDYIVKPIIPLELKTRIQNLLQRKHAEDAMERAKLLAEQASLAKSTFLANMSHEIRTPLNGVLGFAHLIRRGGLSEKQANQLDKLEMAGNHLLGIINDVLDLSKIEANKLVIEEAPVDLAQLVNVALSIIEVSARQKNLRLTSSVPFTDYPLLGDETRIRQALLNYLSNAVKFTERGFVDLSVQVVEEDRDSVVIRFKVTDSGIGISPEDQSKLFQAFQQIDGSVTRKYGGTGLGLLITRRLAEQMGGSAGAVSLLGQGSEFWFSVRLTKGTGVCVSGPLPRPDPAVAIQSHHAGKHILLVEDDPINSEIAQLLLEDVGLIVSPACHGLQAIEKASEQYFSAILMDMQMPKMGGVEATQVIRQGVLNGDTPIIAMTANVFSEDRQQCLDVGMNDFIPKPVNPNLLYQTLDRWLSESDR